MDNIVTKIFMVIGRIHNEWVEINYLPMTEIDCNKFIKKQGINKYYHSVYLLPYYGDKQQFIL